MYKVAVIYTGSLRTIRKTMQYFKKNVLLHSNVHVFACVQNDTTLMASQQESWIRSELGDHLKNIEWFNLAIHSDWVKHRDYLIDNMNIEEHRSKYLKNSGSMIEYYQLQLAYIKMVYFERTNGKYDYIIRLRTDTIFAKPIDFHWLHWSDSDVESRLTRIKQELVESNIEADTMQYFMNTILSDTIIPNIYNITGKMIQGHCATCATCATNATSLNNYIKKGSYILTFRNNLLYIIRRDLFYTIPCIGSMYGYFDMNHSYWWNSESQFEAMCHHSNITIYDYSTTFDEKSLYSYDEKRYFDLDYNIMNPFMIYCVVRH